MKEYLTPTSKRDASPFRRIYLSALCLFGLCLVGVLLSLLEDTTSASAFDKAINLSGRQRMLSQRLMVLAAEIMSERNEQVRDLEQEMRESLASFRMVHEALKTGDASLGISEFNSEESLSLLTEIEPHYVQLVESISRLLDTGNVKDKQTYYFDALRASEKFLSPMDKLVFLLTEEASESSSRSHRMHHMLLLLQLVLLLLSAFFLFDPLMGRLRGYHENQEMFLKKLQESKEQFTLAVAGSNDGLWHWDIDSGDVFYSDRMIELLGYKPGEFSHRFETWANTLHPEDYEPTIEAVMRHLEDKSPYDVEYRCKSSLGEYKWFRAKGQAIWDEKGVPTRMAGSLSDITDSKAKKLALESTSKRLELALEATKTGLWDWNLVTNETYFNDSWYTMLGYEPGELPMHLDTWKKLCHPEDLSCALEEISKYKCGKTSIYRCDQRLKRKDGSWMWIADIGKIVEWDQKGNPIRMIGVHIDIELLKEKEEQLQIAVQSAEKAALVKGQFLANMSHEIRTPMNGVIGMIELLLDSDLNEDQSDLASTAHRSAETLLSVINDVLDFSKIEAGKVELAPVHFKLSQFFRDLESLHQIRSKQKDLSFVWSLDDDVPDEVYGDVDRLRQVLVNLVGNAIKFTPSGGAVFLRVEKVQEGKSVTKLRFSVADTGIGVPQQKREKIFKAFEQADSSITREYGGTGLGLTIAARLVELMGGTIGLESQEGTATIFYFTAEFELPDRTAPQEYENEQEKAKEREHLSKPTLPSGLRVLVAEDNTVNQMLVKRLLEKSGCLVSVANNGKEALTLFEKEKFDLILMDIQMPVMGGDEATKAIRESHKGNSIPIVAVTAHAMSGDREKYLSLGMDGYVSKPIKRDDLFNTMRALLERSQDSEND